MLYKIVNFIKLDRTASIYKSYFANIPAVLD